ncbi:MAG TPA: DUF1080 domain-containing protein [Bacteroidales bacterium]|nr:DUF1080 domain-containing protein [Bacteroidales bacterium]
MKIRTFVMMAAAMLVLAGTVQGQPKQSKEKQSRKAKPETVRLFNGKDLKNWAFHLKDPSVDPSGVFTVKNGVINIKGEPFGYMRTKESFSDYTLTLEWRWPSEPTNSGVFVHAQLPDTIWPRCIECQLKAGSAGDFVCMNGADMNERKDKAVRSVKKLAGSSEKPAGEWNKMEVTCLSNTITVSVNGILQNKATGLNINSGHICLQSEGKDLEFRNVVVVKHKK